MATLGSAIGGQRWLVVGFLFTLQACQPSVDFPQGVPLYKVRPITVPNDARAAAELKMVSLLNALAKPACTVRGPEQLEGAKRWLCGDWTAELDDSGVLFVADLKRLWKEVPEGPLPMCEVATPLARSFLDEHGLLVAPAEGIEFSSTGCTATQRAGDTVLGTQVLDTQVVFSAAVQAGQQEDPLRYSVAGGLAARVTFGAGMEILAVSGRLPQQWERTSINVETPSAIGSGSGGLLSRRVRPRPVYSVQKDATGQDVLAPAWIVNSNEARTEGARMPLQIVPSLTDAKEIRLRNECPEKAQVSDSPLPTGKTGLTCGTEWIDHRLAYSCLNKQGFLDGCERAGGTVRFDHGRTDAQQVHFAEANDSFVDSVDIVFYSGHADEESWALNCPKHAVFRADHFLDAPDGYGKNLKWLAISACGPLQSKEYVKVKDRAVDRWRPMFKGLHALLGFGSNIFDTPDEGRRFMELTGRGWGVIDAWIRAAQEIQPMMNGEGEPVGPKIYVAAIYAHNEKDHCARTERLPKYQKDSCIVPDQEPKLELIWTGT